MKDYELVFILTPQLSDEDVLGMVDKITHFISDKGGEIIKVDRWGRYRFAYPLKHFREGNYVLAQLKMEPKDVKGLEDDLRLREEVLRHLLVKLEE